MSFQRSVLAFAVLFSVLLSQLPVRADTSWQILLQRGYEQLRLGQSQAALQTLGNAVRANPSSLDARRYLAQALVNCGLSRKAAEQMELVVKSDPGHAADLCVLGTAYFYNGEAEQSIKNYLCALQADPALEAASLGLVNAYLAQGQTEKAQQVCLRALRLARDEASASRFLSRLADIKQRLAVAPPSIEG